MTSKDLYLSYDNDTKKVVFLCVKKNFSLIDACKIIFLRYCRFRQKAYELRKKKHIEKVIEDAKKNIISIEEFSDSEIPAQIDAKKLDVEVSVVKDRVKEVLKKITNKRFLKEKVDPDILTQNVNAVRKELVKIYLNVTCEWSPDQRLKALDMLAKSLNLYSEKQIALEMNFDISDGELKRLISNLSQNLPAEIDLNQND